MAPRWPDEDEDPVAMRRDMLGCAAWGCFPAVFVEFMLGAALGSAVWEWFEPGSSSRRHAFEEPPALLGGLGGLVVGLLAAFGLAWAANVQGRRGRKWSGDVPPATDSLWDRTIDPPCG